MSRGRGRQPKTVSADIGVLTKQHVCITCGRAFPARYYQTRYKGITRDRMIDRRCSKCRVNVATDCAGLIDADYPSSLTYGEALEVRKSIGRGERWNGAIWVGRGPRRENWERR